MVYSIKINKLSCRNEFARFLIVLRLGFNDTSTLVGHFVPSPSEREKRDRKDSIGDEREGQGRKREMKVKEQKK